MWRRASLLLLALVVSQAGAQAPAANTDYHRRFVTLANQPRLSDSARFQRLLALDWENTMVESPEYATGVGYPGQNRRWTDLSLTAIRRRRRAAGDRLLVLRALDRARLR